MVLTENDYSFQSGLTLPEREETFMALDYHKCAQEIADNIGGGSNVVSAAHCATRLRLVIADNGKVNKEALENVDGVKGMFESNGQLQLIIGTGTVNKVYDEFISITGATAASKEEVKAAAAAKQPWYIRLLKPIGDVFVPILPAIVASGLMMGLVEALAKIPGLGFGDTDWFAFLDMAANTAFAYLPVIVAISAARVFGGNIFLGAVIGLMMIHSALTNGWAAADGYGVWYLFGHIKITDNYTLGQINQLGYQGHVIPVMLAVLFMSKLEAWLHKHVPEMIDLFVTPLTTVLVTALVTFTIIGPIFSGLESIVLAGAEKLVSNPIGSGIMGALYPATVVMGLHHMYNVIEAGMLASKGLNTWMPIIPSSMSAALGITEPAIFGVNMRFFKPFVAGMIGGAVGALVAAFMGIGATAYGVTGIPGYLTINNAALYTIVLLISGGLAFFITTVIWKEEEPKKKAAAPAPAVPAPTNAVISCSAGKVIAPAVGTLVEQAEIPDDTFASGVLGEGVGINPTEGVIFAPFDGEITSVADSKHAIGLANDAGMEVLIHVGVDTVAMNGEGFDDKVAEGDKVKAGQVIMTFDREAIKKANHPDCVVVLLTNSDDFTDVKLGADAE